MDNLSLNREIPRWAVPLQQPARYKGAKGGRGSGKSHFFAEEAVESMVRDPGLNFVCIREIQRALEFSAKSLIEGKIRQFGLEHLFEIQARLIRRYGGTGVMLFEGMQDHTADSIKSLENFQRAWVEEAHALSTKSLKILRPTIRREDSELWFSWNPENESDAVETFFARAPFDSILVHANYLDNPFCPEVMYREAEDAFDVSEDEYEHVWMGGFNYGGQGRVYSSFSPRAYPLGNVDDTVRDMGGDIYVGQDFNVNPMASTIAVRVGDECHVIESLNIETSNTSEVAEEIKRRYPKRHIIFCPDPAGNQRRSSTTIVGQTDFTILRAAGFEVRAPAAHPPVKDRVNNGQAMLLDKKTKRRRVRIHPDAKHLIKSLNAFSYKEGTSIPDKTKGYDHHPDAFSYLLWQEFNVLVRKAHWGSASVPYKR